jgi:hypothetical protein
VQQDVDRKFQRMLEFHETPPADLERSAPHQQLHHDLGGVDVGVALYADVSDDVGFP